MPMTARLWTLNALAVELDRDRRTLARELDGLQPDATGRDASGRVSRKFRMSRVVAHLLAAADGLDPIAERARRDKEAADKLALENAETRGDIARLSVIERELSAVYGELRANALALPGKLAPILEQREAAAIQAALQDAVYELLTDLADYTPGRRG